MRNFIKTSVMAVVLVGCTLSGSASVTGSDPRPAVVKPNSVTGSDPRPAAVQPVSVLNVLFSFFAI